MSLKERIRKEMVIDEDTLSLVKAMYKSLPTQLQTIENFNLIERWAKIAYDEDMTEFTLRGEM